MISNIIADWQKQILDHLMFDTAKKPSINLLVLLVFSFGVFFHASCKSIASPTFDANAYKQFKVSDAVLKLVDTEKFDFQFRSSSFDGKRFLISYRKYQKSSKKYLGRFFRISENGSAVFGKEYPSPKLFENDEKYYYFFQFLSDGLSIFIRNDEKSFEGTFENMYFSRSDGDFKSWSKPSRINDEKGTFQLGCGFIQDQNQNLYCVWQDIRTGIKRIYFSASYDGGKTWRANIAIEDDFRKAGQEFPRLALGENGRLLAFWTDRRDEKTLLDIRSSYSDDGGRTWTRSKKINDDGKSVWQIAPRVVNYKGTIVVAFSDFRENGIENDRDWNIYYARSTDNGKTWEKNKRLNDVNFGRQENLVLSKDRDGNFYSLWVTKQNSLFGQVAFSYSIDGGTSWSPSILLSKENEMVSQIHANIPVVNKNILALWVKETYGKTELESKVLEITTDRLLQENQEYPKPLNSISTLRYEFGEKIFEDDFSNGKVKKWKPVSGVWDIVEGAYRGVRPNEHKPFLASAKFDEPNRYIVTGRFKLDANHHFNADFYFRMSKSNLRYYVIRNGFRQGSWLSIKDNDLPRGLHHSGGKVLEQRHFPFRQDRWYKFTLVVTPEQVDYYVDGKLMISHPEKLLLPNGKFGIGGEQSAPTYFDDISIFSFKK